MSSVCIIATHNTLKMHFSQQFGFEGSFPVNDWWDNELHFCVHIAVFNECVSCWSPNDPFWWDKARLKIEHFTDLALFLAIIAPLWHILTSRKWTGWKWTSSLEWKLIPWFFVLTTQHCPKFVDFNFHMGWFNSVNSNGAWMVLEQNQCQKNIKWMCWMHHKFQFQMSFELHDIWNSKNVLHKDQTKLWTPIAGQTPNTCPHHRWDQDLFLQTIDATQQSAT